MTGIDGKRMVILRKHVVYLSSPTARSPDLFTHLFGSGGAATMTPEAMLDWLDALLKSGADINGSDKNGVTALHHAVRFRSPIAVKTLLEHGANVNQVCRRSGSTPLHRAVTSTGAPHTAGKQTEAREIVTLLLAAGADPSIQNKRGKKPVDYVNDTAMMALFADDRKTRRNRSRRRRV